MRLLSLITLSAFLAGCAAGSSGHYTQSVQSWRGGNTKSLLNVWGKPYEITAGEGGKIIYVYKRQGFTSTNASYSPNVGVHTRNGSATVVTTAPNINSTWNRSFAAYCLTIFTATPAGKIIDTNIQGSNCYISQSAATRLANPMKSGNNS